MSEERIKEGSLKAGPKELGRRGEQAACALLIHKGYEILERNWTCPAGEADIIALDGSCLVFIEVKTRSGVKRGMPSEAVTPKKRARYEKIAAYYLDEYVGDTFHVRFDVMSLLVTGKGRALVRHYVNAFGEGSLC
ncbi:YraN family protein [Slackia exigua]|uniref:YraN family protein n=1 Tax=Slackia exigua TaxID=84109 RepID=UPI00254B9CBA|nr:YraN family protein [Slackia exigua]MDK7723790.1 YraN family protein [Slackia exigua]MDK7725956.1 YraN family protein [Slackia exigua]